jgi:hypothetical protein
MLNALQWPCINIYVYANSSVHTRTLTHSHTVLQPRGSAMCHSVYICAYACMHAYIYIYIYTYIHTYMHTLAHTQLQQGGCTAVTWSGELLLLTGRDLHMLRWDRAACGHVEGGACRRGMYTCNHACTYTEMHAHTLYQRLRYSCTHVCKCRWGRPDEMCMYAWVCGCSQRCACMHGYVVAHRDVHVCMGMWLLTWTKAYIMLYKCWVVKAHVAKRSSMCMIVYICWV